MAKKDDMIASAPQAAAASSIALGTHVYEGGLWMQDGKVVYERGCHCSPPEEHLRKFPGRFRPV